MIAIIDYGCGNLNAFINSFKRLNIKAIIASRPKDLEDVRKIILPGVGSFDYVMNCFNASGLRDIVEKVMLENIDILGICAGMQIFAESSEEGCENGLGWINGKVRKFDILSQNNIFIYSSYGLELCTIIRDNKLFFEIPQDSRYYFVHSYYFRPMLKRNHICNDLLR